MITCAKNPLDGIDVEKLAAYACTLADKAAAGDGIGLATWANRWLAYLPSSPDKAVSALAEAIAGEMLVCFHTGDYNPTNETLLKRVLWL